jgi:PAS domain S-box-containing protein
VPREIPHDFSELFENASDIIVLNDRAGRIVAANRAAREWGGYTQEDVERGVSLRDVLPSPDYEGAMILTQRALDDLPVPEVYEREAVLRDGRRRILELRSNVLRRAGQPPLLQTIGRDVTDNKEAAAFQNGLLQVSQALLTAQTLDELGRVICEAASRVLHVDSAYLWLRRGDALIGCAAAGVEAGGFVGLRRPVEGSFIGEIYRVEDILVVNDFQASVYAQHRPARELRVQALLAVPLRRSAHAVGLLVFTDNVNPRRFTDRLREQALIFGAQTTVAIEAALAREREEEEGRVSAALLRVTHAIGGSLEQSDVLREIVRGARAAVGGDWSTVTLRDMTSGVLRVVATDGWTAEAADELRLVDFHPDTFEELRPLLQHETVEVREPPPRQPLYERWSVSSMLSVPMVRGDRLIGSISVGFWKRRGPFSARERRIAEGVAAQAAVAVENARLVQDLRAANRLKSEFLGAMSHDLRTPLSAILGYAELLRDGTMGPVGAEQADVLDRVLLNGRSLLELINMVLDANRLEAGRVALQQTDFSLADLLAELRNEFALRVRDGVALVWPERVDVPVLSTDHGKLKAVLRNLVDNALKFTARGSVVVSVSSAYQGDHVRIAVRDTGVGIAASAIPSIFEMFHQLDTTRAISRVGVGLGLYVVRRYAELLGGNVAVDSVLGEGSTFTVEIPRRLPSA